MTVIFDLEFTFGISGVMVTLNRYMDTHIPAIMAMSRPWRGLPWVPKPFCRKKENVCDTED